MNIGRMEVNYGDQLAIGSVGWANTGRAFDGVALSYDNKFGKTDFFVMTIDEQNGSPGNYDHDLHGIYHSGSFGKNFKEVDLYFLFDENIATDTTVQALGLRFKSKIDGGLDYRAEVIFEEIDVATASESASMFDVELGYTAGKFRLAAEFSKASEFFNQLYPTAHKWMGYSDLFKRQNIQEIAFHLNYAYNDKTSARLSYHLFDRVERTNSNYDWSGTSAGTAGSEDALASEIDLTVKHQLGEALALQAGVSVVLPGDHYEGNGLKDTLTWGYAQIVAKF